MFPIASKPLAFLFLILDMAPEVVLHKTAITKVFLEWGVEKAPTNRMKQSKTEEPSVNDWGNAAGEKGGQRGNTFPRDKVTTRCRTARFCDQGREKRGREPCL